MWIFDKSLITFILGPIVGYMVASGSVDAGCTSSVTNALNLEIGAVIFLVSLAIGTLHHTSLVKTSLEGKLPPVNIPVPQTPLEPSVQ